MVEITQAYQTDDQDHGLCKHSCERSSILTENRNQKYIESYIDHRSGNRRRKTCLLETVGGINTVDDNPASNCEQKSHSKDLQRSNSRQITVSGKDLNNTFCINRQASHTGDNQKNYTAADLCQKLSVVLPLSGTRVTRQTRNRNCIDSRHQSLHNLINLDGNCIKTCVIISSNPSKHRCIRADIDCNRQTVGEKDEHRLEMPEDLI